MHRGTSLPPRSPRHKRLGELLARRRDAAGLTQVELGSRLGRPQSFVGKYETGQVYLDVIDFFEIAAAVEASVDTLIEELNRDAADQGPPGGAEPDARDGDLRGG